jgi:hypothetical protein
MMEDPAIIQMNIARYQAMLKRELDFEERSIVQRLLADAEANLVLANDTRTQQNLSGGGRKQSATGVVKQEQISK